MTLKMKLYQFLFLFRVIGICYSLPQTLRQLPQPSDVIFNEHPLSETTKINNQLVGLTTSEHQKLIHSSTERNENGQDVSAVSTYSPDAFHPTFPTERPHIPIAEPNFPRVAVPFAIVIWVFGICIVKTVVNGWPKLLAWFPETCCLIVVGFAVGGILYATKTAVLSPLSSTIFFFCMLPPIILDAGYFMPNRLFFDHFGTILLFAVVATIFNAICIGVSLWACGLSGLYGFEISLLETLLFSSLISAVDPVTVLAVLEEIHVDKVLYIIVFGESLMNDAVSVVLYNMCDSYVTLGADKIGTADVLTGFAAFIVLALGGTIIGIVWGFLAGFLTKFTHRVPVIEPVFVFIMSYAALINAEAFQLSSILSVMFCGITMKNYVAENVSPSSLTTINKGLKAISNCSESIIFMFLGINTVNDHHEWNTAFILLTVFFCTFYRAIGVFLLSEIANYFRLHKLNFVEKLVMSYSGLRGAIAFALVLLIDPGRIPRQPLFVTATITVVFFTIFFQGITIRPLVRFLKVKQEERQEKTMNERLHERMLDYTMAGVLDVLGQCNSIKIRNKFKQWDYAYIRPCLIRGKKHREPKITETYWALTILEATEWAGRNHTTSTQSGSDSLANSNRSCSSSGLVARKSSPQSMEGAARNFNTSKREPSAKGEIRDPAEVCHHHVACKLYRCKSVGHSRCCRHVVSRDCDLSSDPNRAKSITNSNFIPKGKTNRGYDDKEDEVLFRSADSNPHVEEEQSTSTVSASASCEPNANSRISAQFIKE